MKDFQLKINKPVKLSVLFFSLAILFATNLYAKEKPRWGKAKHRCEGGTKGLVIAKLKGVKLGKKKKTCESRNGRTAPPFNARGASGRPSYCKSLATGVYGYWEIDNDPQCKDGKKVKNKQEPYWDKPKHRCIAPNVGRVEARLLGVDGGWWGKKGRKKKLCEGSDAPSINALGVTGKPKSCKKRMVHVYGIWENESDPLCAPKWKKVKAKGCMGPDVENGISQYRQVFRAKITKLKNGGRWWNVTKWKWPLTDKKRNWAREQCMKQVHPKKGKPDYCKIKAGVWAYWYEPVERCEKPLKWAKFRDNGCVKDMEQPNLPGSNIDFTGKRSYTARLKHVAGDWYESCRTWPIDSLTADNGQQLQALKPTGCVLQRSDEIVGVVFGGALSAGAAYYSWGATMTSSASISVAGATATSILLKDMDTTTSVDGILWVDDETCQ